MKTLVMICLITLLSPDTNGDKEKIEYEEIRIMCTQTKGGDEYVITNNNDYQQLLEKRSPHPDCTTYTLREIDFKGYTLIGIHYGVGECKNPDVSFNIYKNDYGNYSIETQIIQYGLCKILNHIRIWVLIPKIDDNAEVKFEKNVVVKDKDIR